MQKEKKQSQKKSPLSSPRRTEADSLLDPKPLQFSEEEGKDLAEELATITRSILKHKVSQSVGDSLVFRSWYMEEGKRNNIKLTFKLKPEETHQILINDMLYTADTLLTWTPPQRVVECWDLYVGAKIDIFGKQTVIKQCDLKTGHWNEETGELLLKVKADLVKEIRKYYSLPLEPIYTNYVPSKLKGGKNLRALVNQLAMLKERLAVYRPLQSSVIMSKFGIYQPSE